MDDRRTLGRRGEDAAKSALLERGYRILARNVRSRAGELDIVCLDGDTFVFCEVKARRPSPFGAPEEALTAVKRVRLARLAQTFLARIGSRGSPWRLELVAVRLDERGGVENVQVVRCE